jgi:dipeptidyl aminopeptidase/acylaminoacyl peptidase
MHRRTFRWLHGWVLFLLVLPVSVSAQRMMGSTSSAEKGSTLGSSSTPDLSNSSLETLFNSLAAVRRFDQVAISPDGKYVAWVEAIVDKKGVPGDKTAIYLSETPPAAVAPRRISASDDQKEYAEKDVSWSPDSKQLAFLSDANPSGRAQLFIVDVVGGKARRLTDLTGSLSDPQWSPDGKGIALLFTENAPRAADPLAPIPPELGVVEDKIYEQRLTTVEVASGKAHLLSPADIHVYEYDWSPDGKTFAVTAAHGVADDNWYLAQLYTISLDSGEMKAIYKPPLQIAKPRWSPDGKSIAFVAGLMSDEGCVGGNIFIISGVGGEARDVTPGIKSSPGWLSWLSREQILFAEINEGSGRIAKLNVGDGKIETVWAGSEVIFAGGLGFYSLSLSADHKNTAVIRQSFSTPPEVWAGPIGAWQQLTHVNSQLHPTWGKVEDLHWTNEGMRVQGWLMYPRDYDPSRRYPMVVVPHGGPGCATLPYFPSRADYTATTSVLSTLAYFLLYPNPRGSLGQGQDYIRGNVKDLGYADFRDILTGIDQVEKNLPIDSHRLGITGWSWGGYWTMWSVTQTDRFQAAVAGAGIVNLQSYYGENDIDKWMLPYFGATVYDDPALYARSSAITFIKNVKTPTLIVVGEYDGECPTPQSREFWHALRDLGVPTELVIYAGEGHAIRDPNNQRDIMERMVNWFNQYLVAKN